MPGARQKQHKSVSPPRLLTGKTRDQFVEAIRAAEGDEVARIVEGKGMPSEPFNENGLPTYTNDWIPSSNIDQILEPLAGTTGNYPVEAPEMGETQSASRQQRRAAARKENSQDAAVATPRLQLQQGGLADDAEWEWEDVIEDYEVEEQPLLIPFSNGMVAKALVPISLSKRLAVQKRAVNFQKRCARPALAPPDWMPYLPVEPEVALACGIVLELVISPVLTEAKILRIQATAPTLFGELSQPLQAAMRKAGSALVDGKLEAEKKDSVKTRSGKPRASSRGNTSTSTRTNSQPKSSTDSSTPLQ